MGSVLEFGLRPLAAPARAPTGPRKPRLASIAEERAQLQRDREQLMRDRVELARREIAQARGAAQGMDPYNAAGMNQGLALAAQAQQYQEFEASQGRDVEWIAAVLHVASGGQLSQSFSEPGGAGAATELRAAAGLPAGRALVRRALDFQETAASAGCTVPIVEAVEHVTATSKQPWWLG